MPICVDSVFLTSSYNHTGQVPKRRKTRHLWLYSCQFFPRPAPSLSSQLPKQTRWWVNIVSDNTSCQGQFLLVVFNLSKNGLALISKKIFISGIVTERAQGIQTNNIFFFFSCLFISFVSFSDLGSPRQLKVKSERIFSFGRHCTVQREEWMNCLSGSLLHPACPCNPSSKFDDLYRTRAPPKQERYCIRTLPRGGMYYTNDERKNFAFKWQHPFSVHLSQRTEINCINRYLGNALQYSKIWRQCQC